MEQYFTPEEIAKIKVAAEAFRSAAAGHNSPFEQAMKGKDKSIIEALEACGIPFKSIDNSVFMMSALGVDPFMICHTLALSVFDIVYRIGRSVEASEQMEKMFATTEKEEHQ